MASPSSNHNSTRETTANGSTSFANSLKRFSIGTAASTALPNSPSPQPSPRSFLSRENSTSFSNDRLPPRSPLQRSPSAMSRDAPSSTPSLLRKASMNSLHGVGGGTPPRPSPSRRSNSAQYQYLNGSTMAGRSALPEIGDETEQRPRHTARSIAHNHFEKELELQKLEDDTRNSDTIAIIHDSCYGHRFSRPRTSKISLSTIVERPERIHASILGLSMAYVRLGERHSDGLYPLHPDHNPSMIPTTPFQIRKTTRRLPLSSQAVTNVHGTKWMEELKIMCGDAEAKLAKNGKELVRPEMDRSGEPEEPAKFHEGDLYLCSESLDAMEGALGAVCEGVDAVFQGSANRKGPSRAFVTIRPPGHHCSASYPSGFCWVNNVHVGISHAALTHGLTHATIIDFDLHHGDGSQAIAWDHNTRGVNLPKNALPWKKTSIGYFSLHDINSYPCEQGDEEKVKMASLCIENAHGQSIWNVHLQPWKTEAEFWQLYEARYSIILEKTRNFLRTHTERLNAVSNGPKPKAAIFFSAGFDASEWESSGMQRHKVNVPTEFYARIARDVVKLAAEEGTSVDGRIISVLEGGYSDRALYSGVFSHLSGLASGAPIVVKQEPGHNGLGYEMGQKIGAYHGVESYTTESLHLETQAYDPLWWSLPRLEQLDATVKPAPPAPEPKKPRAGTPPTYSSPTQSFIAKVVSPRPQRSVSNMSMGNGSPRTMSRPPSPPPPEVHWTVAAHELSKLLIPTDRETMSCKPEDLSAEATRARRDRQSLQAPSTATAVNGPCETASTRMALRARKPAKPIVEEDDVKKPKTTRRRTVAGAANLATDKPPTRSTTPIPVPQPSYTKPTSQSNRRLSLVSNAGSAAPEAPRPGGHRRAPSNSTTTAYQRPGTSQTIRPESSMSSRGHSIPPVVVKKTRAPAQPRAAPAKSSRVRRKSPLGDAATEAPALDGSIESQSRANKAILPSTKPSAQTSDVDSLTSGMKKIKISLTTETQREAKLQAKLSPKIGKSTPTEAVRPRSARRPSRDGSTPAPPPSEPSYNPEQPLYSNPVVMGDYLPPSPSTPQPALLATLPPYLQQPTEVPLPASSPPNPSDHLPTTSHMNSSPDQPMPDSSRTLDPVFISYQPEGPPPDAVPRQQPIHWLPPNTSTPSPMKRANLPVFTSTSVIPFAPNPNVGTQPSAQEPKNDEVPAKEARDENIWDVPETPRK
ncbi:Arginase [Venustampulla echinocandica]|uniref:Arginase n=1 Tax=Venustampulla echinocandica TaxID=2656787 RepID=A0A370TWS0_9HELO|nr:Arginase [Venustampulla echinocandica]RDL39971.1 Arginase [Venustampulla echinocandica]